MSAMTDITIEMARQTGRYRRAGRTVIQISCRPSVDSGLSSAPVVCAVNDRMSLNVPPVTVLSVNVSAGRQADRRITRRTRAIRNHISFTRCRSAYAGELISPVLQGCQFVERSQRVERRVMRLHVRADGQPVNDMIRVPNPHRPISRRRSD